VCEMSTPLGDVTSGDAMASPRGEKKNATNYSQYNNNSVKLLSFRRRDFTI
jgi:hypothetical protein